MAATLQRELGIDAELVEGAGGVFDVEADGRLIFSRHQAERFPEEQEIVAALKAS